MSHMNPQVLNYRAPAMTTEVHAAFLHHFLSAMDRCRGRFSPVGTVNFLRAACSSWQLRKLRPWLATLPLMLSLFACQQVDTLANKSGELACGWLATSMATLPDAPEGRCWLVTSGDPELASALAGVSSCEVSSGPKLYEPGAEVEYWSRAFASVDKASWGYDVIEVDCATRQP